jgi:hypothetical protein
MVGYPVKGERQQRTGAATGKEQMEQSRYRHHDAVRLPPILRQMVIKNLVLQAQRRC